MKKLCLVSGIYPPDIGGPATFIPNLAKRMQLQNYQCTVLTLSDSKSSIRVEHGIRVIRISRKISRIFRVPILVFALLLIGTTNPQFIVNGLYEEFGIANLFLKRKAIIKIVGDPVWERFRNNNSKLISIESFNSISLPLKYKIQRKIFVISLNQANLIVTPGKSLIPIIKSWKVRPRILYIPNGVNISKIIFRERMNRAIVISRLVSWKNIDKAIESCINANLPLDIFGEGPEKERLERISRDSKSEICFYPAVSHKTALDLLSKYNYFILLSEYEGQSFALLEAMSLGCVVIVSDIPANTDVVEDAVNGYVISTDSQEVINAKLRNAISDPNKNIQIRENSIKYISYSHNFENITKQFIELLESDCH